MSTTTDSGWSWVILVGCFVTQGVMSLVYCMGIFNVIFLEVFGQSKQATAWLGSIINIFLILAPVSAWLTEKIGARTTCILGALVCTSGYFMAFFATKFWHVVVCFGLMPGVGLGLCYIPAIVPLGYHFEKYRNLAFGMCSCAVGLGSMAWPVLIYLLEGQYGWRGCLMIVAGIFLHIIISGAVIRPQCKPPPPPPPSTFLDNVKDRMADVETIPEESFNSLSKSKRHSSSEGSLRSNTNSRSKSGITSEVGSLLEPDMTSHPEGTLNDKVQLSREYSNSFLSVTLGLHYNSDFQLHTLHQDSVSNLWGSKKLSRGPTASANTLSASGYLAVSMVTLHSTGQVTNTAEVTTDTVNKKKGKPLFKDPVFYLMCVNNYLLSGAHFMFYMHFPAFCIQKGITNSAVTTIMILVGAAAVVSRLSCGVAANIKANHVLRMYVTFSVLAGIVILVCPLLPGNAALLASVAVLYSICANAYCILMAPLTIELFSLDTLALAYGAESCVCGIGSLLAPPFAGAMWLIGSAVIVIIPYLRAREDVRGYSAKQDVEEMILEIECQQGERDKMPQLNVDKFTKTNPIQIDFGCRNESEAAPCNLPNSAPEGATWVHERMVGRA